MRLRTIKIRIEDKAAARREALEIARRIDRGERDPRWAQEVLTFHDIDSLRSVLTNERLELLRLIHQKRPGSLTELATLSGRDLEQVSEDVRRLALLGFIEVEKEPVGRKARQKVLRPRCDTVLVEIPLT
ncbi:MAG: MarR family transcriptional regulator [Deltaproteobacteria bacterium]|nr:MarR family transcriptional regulator [Deltaproteobacteria bacterium]